LELTFFKDTPVICFEEGRSKGEGFHYCFFNSYFVVEAKRYISTLLESKLTKWNAMEPKIVKAKSLKEFSTPERCSIAENWGVAAGDKKVSVARARVKPGITTKAHHLEGVQEIYLITQGKGKVHIRGLAPTEVSEGDTVVIPPGTSQSITNLGKTDLIFFCVCTPAFTNDCYHDDET
jgi:mannose-6-phosphate isomerase-like protein (cupin superfamily)